MPTRLALLRGINVGGNNPLPMKLLVNILEGLGCEDVATYIQSGNAVFRSRHRSGEALGKAIGEAIAAERGFHPTTFVIDVAALRRIAEANPYPEAEAEPKSLHVWLLAGKPGPGARQKLEALRSGSESFHLGPRSPLPPRAGRHRQVETRRRSRASARPAGDRPQLADRDETAGDGGGDRIDRDSASSMRR